MLTPRIRKLLCSFKNKSKTGRCRSIRKHLSLELLETRLVPTMFTWNNSFGGNWSVGSNWLGGVAPTPASALGGILVFPSFGATGGQILTNDIPGLSVAELQGFDNQNELAGDAITVTGVGGVGITGDLTIGTPIVLATSMTIGANGISMSGVVSGSANLTVDAVVGPVVISLFMHGANTYSGTTTVTRGILIIGSSDANLGAVPTTPTPDSLTLNGGTLELHDPVALNANRGITIGAAGGKIGSVSSGTSTINGIITGTGELVINDPGSDLVALAGGESVNLTGTTAGTGYLQMNVTGSVNLGSSAVLNVSLGYHPTVGDSYTLISNDGSDAVNGTFAGLPEGATLTVGTAAFQITYKGGDGNDVILTCTRSSLTTATTVASSLNPSTYGQSVTFTATVTPGTSSGFSPTGTVTFKDGSTTLGTSAVSTSGGITTATWVTSALNAGTHSQIVAQYAGDSNFAASNSTNFTQTVAAAALTITASDETKIYGQTVAFGSSTLFTSSGLQNSQAIGSVHLAVSNNGGTATAAVGGYAITPSAATGGSFSAGNYAITYVTGALSVNAAALTITASDESKTYGQTLTFGSGSTLFISSGLQNSETIGSVTLAANNNGDASTAAVGGYTIAPSAAAGGSFSAGNYAITYVTGAMSVNAAALTITASDESKTYGQTLTFGTSTLFTSNGLQNSETIGSVTLAVSNNGGAASAAVGGYTITPSAAAGGSFLAGNYAITYATGTLTVNQANLALTVAANSFSKTYGATVSFSGTEFTETGLTNGDTLTSVTLTSAGAAANASVANSPYLITPSNAVGAGLSNYSISYVAGFLTVNPAPLSVTAADQTMVYGSTVPTLMGTLSGVVNGDNISANYGTTATSSSDVVTGGYAITASLNDPNGLLSNYAVTNTPGTLTIAKANQTNLWNAPAAIVYGTALGNAQLNANDTVVGPAAAGALTYTPATGTVLNAGSNQTLTVNAAATTDYNPSSKNVSINVSAAPLSVAVDNQTMVYGSAVPALTGTLSGVVNGDNITASYSTTATSSSDVVTGGYPITASVNDPNGRLSNYTLTNTAGTLTINQANQTINWSNPANINANTPLSGTQLNATVTVVGPAAAGALTYSPTAGTILSAGNGQTLSVNAAPTTDYLAASKNVTINVVSATSISGHVLRDLTGNGASSDDVSLAGVKVYLDLNNNGAFNSNEPYALTDTNGAYSFTGVANGAYIIREVLPSGYVRTEPTLSDNYVVNVSTGSASGGNDFGDFVTLNTNLVSNITYSLNGSSKNLSDLRGNTAQGELVQATFTVAANVSNLPLTLVSYTAPGATFDASSASQQQIFEAATGTFSTGTYTLTVTLPNSYYQVDFVAGPAINTFGPANSNIFYSAQNRLFSADNEGTQPVRANASSLAGMVFSDANNDGIQESGEAGMGLVQVTLSGKDNTGKTVNLTRFTEPNGSYRFDNLAPSGSSGYTITEKLADGFFAGQNTLGTLASGKIGSNYFSGLMLGTSVIGQSYNFAELPQVNAGQTQTASFWNGTSGQALIKKFDGSSTATSLATWLASNFNNLYGSSAGASSLVGKTNADVASLFKKLDGSSSTQLDAQVLAAALNVYATTTSLGGTAATSYGFSVTASGLGSCYVNVGCDGQAFGVANNSLETVWSLLLAVNSASSNGQLFNGNSSLRAQACAAFTSLNAL
jgi:Bacterial Ig-like domain (group 3)/MBG domain (YGX type)/SdrD B-like domain